MSRPNLARRVANAAEIALTRQKYVTFLDVLTGVRWLHTRHVDLWRQGRAPTLEELAAVDGSRFADTADLLRRWAEEKGLTPVEVPYVAGTRDRRELRFTTGADDATERAFRTHWISPSMSETRLRKLREPKTPDLVVIASETPWTCADCRETGPYLIMEDDAPHCLTCADMDHLIFLPAGNAALSRRAKKESGLAAVVVRFNPRRRVYQRRGILVEEAALARAEEQCLADDDARQRRRDRDRERRAVQDVEFQTRMTTEILRLFPACPPDRARSIAEHAALRGSGRVGRTAAARALDENAITLAVVASIRHLDTRYDELLMSGVPRRQAREEIRPALDTKLHEFRRTAGPSVPVPRAGGDRRA